MGDDSAAMPPPQNVPAQPSGAWVEVGPSSQYTRRRGGWMLEIFLHRLDPQVEGRLVALFHTRNGQLYCMDARCYHAGGPLHDGVLLDIEELGGRPCVACPFHGYRIMLDNGEGMYEQIMRRGEHGELKSKGVKQRVHSVKTEDERVFIRLELGGDPCPSDHYQAAAYRRLFTSAPKLPMSAPPPAS